MRGKRNFFVTIQCVGNGFCDWINWNGIQRFIYRVYNMLDKTSRYHLGRLISTILIKEIEQFDGVVTIEVRIHPRQLGGNSTMLGFPYYKTVIPIEKMTRSTPRRSINPFSVLKAGTLLFKIWHFRMLAPTLKGSLLCVLLGRETISNINKWDPTRLFHATKTIFPNLLENWDLNFHMNNQCQHEVNWSNSGYYGCYRGLTWSQDDRYMYMQAVFTRKGWATYGRPRVATLI